MVGESGREKDRGNMRRRRMDIGKHFASKENGSREFGEWMREKSMFRKFWMSSRVSEEELSRKVFL